MNSLWKCKDSRNHVTRCISGLTRQGQSKEAEWGRPSSEGITCKKKKRKSQLFISFINADNWTPHHEHQQLLHFFSSWTDQSGLISWQAPFTPTPVYSQLWTEIWCFRHNFYCLSYTPVSVSYSSLGWESAPPAVCLLNQIQMFTEQKTEFWINF